jgi:hypothetical protein
LTGVAKLAEIDSRIDFSGKIAIDSEVAIFSIKSIIPPMRGKRLVSFQA